MPTGRETAPLSAGGTERPGPIPGVGSGSAAALPHGFGATQSLGQRDWHCAVLPTYWQLMVRGAFAALIACR